MLAARRDANLASEKSLLSRPPHVNAEPEMLFMEMERGTMQKDCARQICSS